MNGGGDRPSLEAVDLTATYRGRAGEAVQALTDISTSFRPGHLAVVLGPSGSGKSTLLHSGGHSFGAFGLVNPIAAMSQAVVELYRTQVPARPKTIYSASVTGGGTSVNSIPNEVWMEFDMRSEHAGELDKLEKHFLTILNQAVETENNARSAKRRGQSRWTPSSLEIGRPVRPIAPPTSCSSPQRPTRRTA